MPALLEPDGALRGMSSAPAGFWLTAKRARNVDKQPRSNLVDMSVFKNKTNDHPLRLLIIGGLGGKEMEFLYKLSPKLSRLVLNFYDYLPLF